MSFEEPNDPRSSEIVNQQIQLTELATYKEQTPGAGGSDEALQNVMRDQSHSDSADETLM